MTIASSRMAIAGNAGIKDDPEKYVRESYTWRPMAKWQVYSLTAISGALLLAIVISAFV